MPVIACIAWTRRAGHLDSRVSAHNLTLIKWVMAQVGHADSKMTMDVYAQLEQRADRSHGTQFDALQRPPSTVSTALIGPRLGHETEIGQWTAFRRQEEAPQKAALCRLFSDGETRTRTGDTTIFSRVLYQLSYLAARRRW